MCMCSPQSIACFLWVKPRAEGQVTACRLYRVLGNQGRKNSWWVKRKGSGFSLQPRHKLAVARVHTLPLYLPSFPHLQKERGGSILSLRSLEGLWNLTLLKGNRQNWERGKGQRKRQRRRSASKNRKHSNSPPPRRALRIFPPFETNSMPEGNCGFCSLVSREHDLRWNGKEREAWVRPVGSPIFLKKSAPFVFHNTGHSQKHHIHQGIPYVSLGWQDSESKNRRDHLEEIESWVYPRSPFHPCRH